MKEIKLSELFDRCLRAKYIHTVEDGDYAIEREGDTLVNTITTYTDTIYKRRLNYA